MLKFLWPSLGAVALPGLVLAQPAPPLFLAYPPTQYQTTSDRIFLIGSAPPAGQVLVNGQPIARSSAGYFAPSFPLHLGRNQFNLQYQNQRLTVTVLRQPLTGAAPTGLIPANLTPTVDQARLPGELECFTAQAPPGGKVEVVLAGQHLPLAFQPQTFRLPPNSAVLTSHNQPLATGGVYSACTNKLPVGNLGQPVYRLTLDGQTTSLPALGTVEVLAPDHLSVARVTVPEGVARTGPSTEYSRLTPLPRGTEDTITGQAGAWWRLAYGGWIRQTETQVLPNAIPPQSLIRSVSTREVPGWTEVVFPLQVPVPITVDQESNTLTLTLHHTTAQTDTVRMVTSPVISHFTWRQSAPGEVQYTFYFRSQQQWGYQLRYQGSTLILSLRHPPRLQGNIPLGGVTILLDPGHGGPVDLGARGPTGYPEKRATLIVAKLLRQDLEHMGARVVMTRTQDVDLSPTARGMEIEQIKPTLALSLHYNALPDDGDALHTAGLSTYWYNPQSESLAIFLHDYLIRKLHRPDYGVFWDSLAVNRPTVCPIILMESGFMINPEDFAWISNPQAQQQLAAAIAQGLAEWIHWRTTP